MMKHGSPGVPIEIERKFLVTGEGWREGARSVSIRQGYLARSDQVVVRVRVADQRATLTIKGKSSGLTTPEFEYPIPLDHAESLLALCDHAIVEKVRYLVPHRGHEWEVDVFSGENAGLILAEIELDCEDEAFSLPAWVGAEVSHDPRYKNARLCLEPYRADWDQAE
jgi:CYTH domain-containing protein